MTIPTIQFTYSWVYDKQWQDLYNLKIKVGELQQTTPYPTTDETLAYIQKVQPLWEKDSQAILAEVSKITTLTWQKENIPCYVVGRKVPFSDPLTLPVYSDKYVLTYFVDALTHELIHQLFIQNEIKLQDFWKFIDKEYEKEPLNTRMHITLHAIHEHIFRTVFDEKRLEREQGYVQVDAYKRSWEIVKNKGYKNIIQEFIDHIS